jgi:hypothetical protein
MEIFGVSSAFLDEGAVLNERDVIATAVAASLQRAETEGVRWLPSGPHRRLRSAREAAGYASAMAAASAFGWSITTYGVHESGRRTMPIDQFFQYANAFGVGYDLLLFGEGVGGRDEQEILPVLERLTGTLQFAWPWMVTDRMTILRRTRRRFRVGGSESLRAASGHLASLAVIEKTLAGTSVYVLAPPDARLVGKPQDATPDRPRWLLCDGQDLFEYHEPRGFVDDPLVNHGGKLRPLLLGRLLQTYRL